MKKSTMWSLAMALATSMSGGASITNLEDDDSKPEETVNTKSHPQFEEELIPLRSLPLNKIDHRKFPI